MRTGFEKINQVLTTELATDLAAQDRKVILFTDSRQDAAKLSSGLGLRHYQDLLRLLLVEYLNGTSDPSADLAMARTHIAGNNKTAETWEAIDRLEARDANLFGQLRKIWEGRPGTDPANEPEAQEVEMEVTDDAPLPEPTNDNTQVEQPQPGRNSWFNSALRAPPSERKHGRRPTCEVPGDPALSSEYPLSPTTP